MEVKIEKYLTQSVENQGGMCLKFPPIFFSGFPDRIVLLPGGVIVFVETKATGKKLRPLQRKVHARLQCMGFRVEVLDSHESIDGFILTL